MRMERIVVMTLALALLGPCAIARDVQASLEEFRQARRTYDPARTAEVRDALTARAEVARGDYVAQFDAAEALRMIGAELRTRRQTHALPGAEVKALKEEQGRWSEAGLVFAERALSLAATEAEQAAAHRVYGELYANSISGMVSGLRNGPKAREHLDQAMARTPQDPECLRALGIMYLNNPPFNGGDVKKAIETFSVCHAAAPDDDIYLVLLAMAHQKDKNWSKALETVEQALVANPANPNAAALKKAVEARQEASE